MAHNSRWRPTTIAAGAIFVVLGLAFARPVEAQRGQYYKPLKQDVPVGVAGNWAGTIRPGLYGACQEIRVELPGEGMVTFYQQGAELATVVAPAQAGFHVGPVYRIRISNMPDFPGTELYPTVELISRLHPPSGKESLYPVPIAFTEDEIRMAIEGRMITKIIYLEQPDLAPGIAQGGELPTTRVPEAQDALEVADELGRPMAIVRLGGRVPSPAGITPGFLGSGAPVRIQQPGEVREVPRSAAPRAKEASKFQQASHTRPAGRAFPSDATPPAR